LDLGHRFTDQGIVDFQPAVLGDAYVTLVPRVDADGLDLGGIRLPGVAVPLSTYTGWNLHKRGYGAPNGLGRWAVSFFSFSITAGKRANLGDSRLSLAERYPNRSGFLSQTKLAGKTLAAEGFILTPDIPDMVAKAGRAYDVLVVKRPPGCAYLEGFG
jgi:hypothetical protein